MSLLNYASPWISDDGNTKKRAPSIRKIVKNSIANDSGGEPEEYNNTDGSPSTSNTPLTLDEVQSYQTDNGKKVNELLDKMTTLDAENDGAHLANFSPITPPEITNKKPNPYVKKQDNLYDKSDSGSASKYTYVSDNRTLGNLTNYQNVYEGTPLFQKNNPYYAKMGISNGVANGIDDKLMERINYMVHLLEEQQHEKTANITEEFLLYTFLGVFVIYVVDTFSRNGKYVR
jgi:hypothetical protein